MDEVNGRCGRSAGLGGDGLALLEAGLDLLDDAHHAASRALDGSHVVARRRQHQGDDVGLGLGPGGHLAQLVVAVVKNALAREAFKGHALEPLAPHLAGPSALVYSQDSVIDL
ncbi:MAG: 50S ribosomal protein L10, partial [Phycisphaerales bacterium]